MNSARKMMMAATAAAVLCLMGGCGDQSRKTLNCAEAAEIFLVHYERAVNGSSPIEYYSAYAGRYYQGTSSRREAARRWYNYFTS